MPIRSLFIVCLLMSLMSGCVQHTIHHERPHAVEVTRTLPYFDKVYVNVPVNVTLRTQRPVSRVIFKGNSADIPLIYTTVKNQTLYITLGSLKPHTTKKKILYGPIDITIDMPALHYFAYKGKGIVQGKIDSDHLDMWIKNPKTTVLDGRINLHHLTVVGSGVTKISGIKGNNLRVDLYGNPKVELTGMAALSALNLDGNAEFSFYWVNAQRLTIRARKGSGKIKLAGVVDRLDVDLRGNTYLDASYIRARETFVKTRGHSVAKIATTARQHTLAKEASDIYFYNLPPNRTDFMGKNGAVLDMRPWEVQLEQTYTQYNK